jgi:hypothetical protein
MEIPVATLPLFAPLDDQLIRLLRTLEPGDWQKPTRAVSWTVKDIVSHLLDGNLRMISIIEAPDNSLIKIIVTGEQGGQWFLFRTNHQWKLTSEIQEQPSAEVAIDPVTAWQLFTKGINGKEALKRMELSGDVELGKPILDMVSVMALRK